MFRRSDSITKNTTPSTTNMDVRVNVPSHARINYESLFRALPDPYIVFDVDDPYFTIIEQSDAHAAMSMVQSHDVIGKPLLIAYPDVTEKYRKTGVSDLLESIRRVIRTGKPDDMSTMRYDLKDEHGMYVERYFLVTHYPLFDIIKPGSPESDKQEVAAVVQATVDVTDSTISTEKLHQTQRQLAEALEIAQVGTWVWDITSGIITADKNLSRMFGLSADDGAAGLPLKAFIKAIHPNDRKRVQSEIATAIDQKTLFDTEYRTIDVNGAIHWLLVRGRIETDASGKPIKFPGVLLDITDRKHVETNRNFLVRASTIFTSSLNYSKTLKSIAKSAVPDIADWCVVDVLEDGMLREVAVAHKDSKKVAWATKLRAELGMNSVNEDTAAARTIRTAQPTFIPVIDEAFIRKNAPSAERLKLALQLELTSLIVVPIVTDTTVAGVITLMLAGSNRHYDQADFDMAIELANHASLAITNARLYDETKSELKKRRLLEDKLRTINDGLEQRVRDRTEKLEASNADLNRSNRELQDFAYVASHDLQEPLRKIQAFGNLLEQEYGTKLDEGADYLHRMQNAAARMSNLITDLLSFSRVTTKEQELVSVDLNTVAAEVIEDLAVRVSETNGTVDVSKLPTIDADPLQMRQLFQNLIGNALKFHKVDVAPRVTVAASTTTKSSNQMVKLTFKDNGVGFDPKYLDRIFSVFQRLHGRGMYEGTGIGLAVCRKIVERHHGTITATSRPDKGATFIVYLPLKKSNLHHAPIHHTDTTT